MIRDAVIDLRILNYTRVLVFTLLDGELTPLCKHVKPASSDF